MLTTAVSLEVETNLVVRTEPPKWILQSEVKWPVRVRVKGAAPTVFVLGDITLTTGGTSTSNSYGKVAETNTVLQDGVEQIFMMRAPMCAPPFKVVGVSKLKTNCVALTKYAVKVLELMT